MKSETVAALAVVPEWRATRHAGVVAAQPYHVIDRGTLTKAVTRCGLTLALQLQSVEDLDDVTMDRRCRRHGCRQAWSGAPRTRRPRTLQGVRA